MNNNTKEAYQEKAEAQLKELEARIDLLRSKADQAKAEVKIEYLERLEDLRGKQAEAQRKLEELKQSSKEAWSEFTSGVDQALDNLRQAVEQAAEKVR